MLLVIERQQSEIGEARVHPVVLVLVLVLLTTPSPGASPKQLEENAYAAAAQMLDIFHPPPITPVYS